MNNRQNHKAKTRQNSKKEIQAKKFKRAVSAVFPNAESFINFKKTQHSKTSKNDLFIQASEKFIHHAYKYELIREETEDAFMQFIQDVSQAPQIGAWDELAFAEIIDEIKKTWPDEPTIRRLIRELNPITEQFGLNKIQAATFSRLKNNFNTDTAVNQATLRILTFWIAVNCPEYHWNYTKFEKFGAKVSQKQIDVPIEQGIVCVFSVQSRKGIVITEVIDWLKHELKKCITYLRFTKEHIERFDLHAKSMSFINLRISNMKKGKLQPRLYAQAIKYGMSIVHQMICRWFLQSYCLESQKILIGVYAGPFENANLFRDALFELLPEQRPEIILNEFAFQCARLADVKVTFKPFDHHQKDFQRQLANSQYVEYFQAMPYFEFIPALLKPEYIPISKKSEDYETFHRELYFPETVSSEQFKVLSQMRQLPGNFFLAAEVVKVLIAREMFYEADEILTGFLVFEPRHVLMRTLRMFLYAHLAEGQQDFDMSERIFKRAIAEGEFLINHQACHEDSEVWCIFGLIWYERAMKCLKLLRNTPHEPINKEESDKRKKIRENCFIYLKKAANMVERGSVISHSGKDRRPIFLEIVTNGHIELFRRESDKIFKHDAPIQDRDLILRKIGMEYITMVFGNENIDLIKKRIQYEFMKTYADVVVLRTFLPNLKFMSCTFLWDFMPILNMSVYNMVIERLKEAREDALSLLKDNLMIYSIAKQGPFPNDPSEFAAFVSDTIKKLETLKPNAGEDADQLFDAGSMRKMSKVLLHFQYLQWKEKQNTQ